ncbi:hypothetical protein Hanom_Chr05g00414791 [Helianthus anomalus]
MLLQLVEMQVGRTRWAICCADEVHAPVWNLKQKDTFDDFGACREWFLGAFPPVEVCRQRDRGHDNFYPSYIMGQENSSVASHQILREWRTMHLEWAGWENYHEHLSAEAKVFEQVQIKLQADKAAFEKEKKCEEIFLLRSVSSDNENKKMYVACAKIISLEAGVANLKKSEAAFKEKYEEEKSHRERVERSKRWNPLRFCLEVEKVKAETAEEAQKISISTLNVTQTNYAEAQSIVDSLLSDSEWMQHHGVTYVANYILNATELDKAVAALTKVARAAGHCAGYVECTNHVEATLKQHFGTRHRSVNEQVVEMLVQAEETYDNVSLPVMDLVTEA